MNRNTYLICSLAITLAGLAGCSSEQSDKKTAPPRDKIQGKAQVGDPANATAADAALNAGGPSLYLQDGLRRYRLFVKSPVQVVAGNEYIAEGVYAQKAIDEIGDPDQGKGGYPLQSSCASVVRTAWWGLAFDVTDAHTAALRAMVKRYPARPIFLVTKLTPVEAKQGGAKEADASGKDAPTVTVAAAKQRALLVEGPTVQTAPLWDPAGATVSCAVLLGTDGKIEELQTGKQLCEAVPWAQFRFQPPVQGGHPVKVKTEVEVRFDARK
jgi:hypothetical protein